LVSTFKKWTPFKKKGGKKVPFFGLATPEYGFLDKFFFFHF
jgi:hypothetical protein